MLQIVIAHLATSHNNYSFIIIIVVIQITSDGRVGYGAANDMN